jgi:hypothetical protein
MSVSSFTSLSRTRHPPDPAIYGNQAVRPVMDQVWPFSDPRPRAYYDARALSPYPRFNMHAKSVVVDGEAALVTSANFTRRAHEHTSECGAFSKSRCLATILRGSGWAYRCGTGDRSPLTPLLNGCAMPRGRLGSRRPPGGGAAEGQRPLGCCQSGRRLYTQPRRPSIASRLPKAPNAGLQAGRVTHRYLDEDVPHSTIGPDVGAATARLRLASRALANRLPKTEVSGFHRAPAEMPWASLEPSSGRTHGSQSG